VPRSAVLGHAEALLAASRHLITNENCAAHFLRRRAASGANFHAVRRNHDQSERIALIVKRREGRDGRFAGTDATVRRAGMRKTSPRLIKLRLPASWTTIRPCTSILCSWIISRTREQRRHAKRIATLE